MHAFHRLLPALILTIGAASAQAELVSLQITQRAPFAGGQTFGDVGAYEQIIALARFAIDPREACNRGIVDLLLAPTNAQGKVEFAADVVILVPKDLAKGNGAIFYDVNNRGNKLALGMFNRPPGGPGPDAKNPAGDGFLMKQGYTIVWSGWIGELLPSAGKLLLEAPQARENGKLVRGLVRQEMSSDSRVDFMLLSRRPGHGSYPPTEEGEARATLTQRKLVDGPREIVPREKWKLQKMGLRKVGDQAQQTLPEIRLVLKGGFEPGVLYELIYEGEGSLVQGVGFASVRDLISFLRHDATPRNPLAVAGKPAIHRAFAFGVSQSGRFLRSLLYLGFNEDEQGRIVFEGLMPHVAGGGLGFFNHRFAQPNRHNGQHEDHLYPADMFPFTYGPSTDPYTKKTDSILGRYGKSKTQPKIMHTQSAAEYWHRAGSLVHTEPGPLIKPSRYELVADAKVPNNVRIYSFGGTQHGPAGFPPSKGISDNYANFGDYRPFLRGLIIALDDWVRDGKAPPTSVYPRRKNDTLVPWLGSGVSILPEFPKIPGVRFPHVIQHPSLNDYGERFATEGIISNEPPKVLKMYTVCVPKWDADGNDLGMLSPPEVQVPLGTYTGWNLRSQAAGADGMLTNLQGSFIPFPVKAAVADPRKPVLMRYADVKAYCQRLDEACERLVADRYMLAEDRPRYVNYGTQLWDFVVMGKK